MSVSRCRKCKPDGSESPLTHQRNTKPERYDAHTDKNAHGWGVIVSGVSAPRAEILQTGSPNHEAGSIDTRGSKDNPTRRIPSSPPSLGLNKIQAAATASSTTNALRVKTKLAARTASKAEFFVKPPARDRLFIATVGVCNTIPLQAQTSCYPPQPCRKEGICVIPAGGDRRRADVPPANG